MWLESTRWKKVGLALDSHVLSMIHLLGFIGEQVPFKLEYTWGAAEALAEKKMEFDIVTALDIIEHIPDQTQFLCTCLSLVKVSR